MFILVFASYFVKNFSYIAFFVIFMIMFDLNIYINNDFLIKLNIFG